MRTRLVQEHWSEAPCDLRLSEKNVHLWLAQFNQGEIPLSDLWVMLSAEERDKSRRFRHHYDQQRYIIRHGILRLILARYLASNPKEIVISEGMFGKPFVTDVNHGRIEFNVTHSEKLMLLAFTHEHRVGVDIEHIKDFPEVEYITEAFFSSEEKAIMCRVPLVNKLNTFFRLWTRKEAYTKALGLGIYQPEIPSLLSKSAEKVASRWTVESFIPANDFVAALAIELPIREYCHKEWQFDQFAFDWKYFGH